MKQPARPRTSSGAVNRSATEVGKGLTGADKTAAEANKAAVGTKAEQDNESRARDPNLRPKGRKDVKEPAEAIGRTTTSAAEVVGSVVQDSTRATDKPGSYRPFAIELNPLGLIVGGRVSVQAEWAPVTHHVLLLSPHFIHTGTDVSTGANTTERQTFTGAGGELGYRYYTGHRGMNGFFIGPSVIGGVYNASFADGTDQVFTNWGIAADIGVQGIVADHLVLGGGVGVEYLHVNHDFGNLASTGQSAIGETGFKPRLLFSGGYAF